MRKMMLTLITATMVIFTATSLTGCGLSVSGAGPETEKPAVVSLVVGNHACSLAPNLNSPKVKEMVSDAIHAYGFVSLVSVDGSPQLIAADNYDIPEQYKHADAAKLRADADTKTLGLLQKVSGITADDPESDVLEALRIAVRSLASGPEGAMRAIYVIDTGLSTTGFLDFRKGILDGDPEAIARALSDKHAVPDFEGITVYWQQMGDVGAPQAKLSPGQRIRLTEIWEAVIEAGGGRLEVREEVPNNSVLGEGLPAVSVVGLETEESVALEDVEPAASLDFESGVILGKEEVRFMGNTAAYTDREAAENVLASVAEYLGAHKEMKILIIGTTAGDESGGFEMELSEARAEMVRTTLEELGAGREQMETVGLGSSDPWHIPDAGTTGEAAERNRKVVLLDASTEEAKGILAQMRDPLY